jgi:hypothetical protein
MVDHDGDGRRPSLEKKAAVAASGAHRKPSAFERLPDEIIQQYGHTPAN